MQAFLPRMALAQEQLGTALATAAGRQGIDLEHVEGEEAVIEMDIAMVGEGVKEKEEGWSSDSEADSTPSPSENSFTSDTDVSSSDSCSSSSEEEVQERRGVGWGEEQERKGGGGGEEGRKRPLIEELPAPTAPKTPRQC